MSSRIVDDFRILGGFIVRLLFGGGLLLSAISELRSVVAPQERGYLPDGLLGYLMPVHHSQDRPCDLVKLISDPDRLRCRGVPVGEAKLASSFAV